MIDNINFLNPGCSFNFQIDSSQGWIEISYEGVNFGPTGNARKVSVHGSIGSREEYDAVINYLIGMAEVLRKRKEGEFPE